MGKNKLYITINDKKYSNHNNILSDIAIKLEDIINTLSKDNIEEIKERITDIIIMTNAIIEENNENFKAIDAEIKNLNRKIYSKNNIIEKVFDEGKFIGTLINYKKEGKGKFSYNDGNTYEGEYKNDMREGRGIYRYKNGDKYIGEWKKDKKHGKGIIFFSNGERYEGDFKEGNFDGFGMFYYINGEKYIGEYTNGRRDGYGIRYFENNSIRLLKYDNSKKIDSYNPDF